MTRALSILVSAFQLFSFSAFGADAVTLLWDRNAEREVTGYEAGIGSASRSYTTITDAGDNTELRVNVSAVAPSYLAVRAYDAGGLRSDWSGEVVFTPNVSAPQFYLGIQPVSLMSTTAPPVLPPSFAPVEGYLFTAEMRAAIGGPVTRASFFVEEGGNGFLRVAAIGTNAVPKSGSFTVASRKAVSISPITKSKQVSGKVVVPTTGSKKGKL